MNLVLESVKRMKKHGLDMLRGSYCCHLYNLDRVRISYGIVRIPVNHLSI